MKTYVRLLVAALILVLGVCTVTFMSTSTPATGSVLYKGKISFISDVKSSNDASVAPVFSWYDENGKAVSLKDYRGKIVFLNFWGTWCGPCRHELPDIVALEKQYKDKVVFLGIALERDNNNVLDRLQSFTQQNHMEYEILVGSRDVANAYGGISGIPTTFIIDKKGKIVDTAVGMRDHDTFNTMLQKVM